MSLLALCTVALAADPVTLSPPTTRVDAKKVEGDMGVAYEVGSFTKGRDTIVVVCMADGGKLACSGYAGTTLQRTFALIGVEGDRMSFDAGDGVSVHGTLVGAGATFSGVSKTVVPQPTK
ncbi:MAG: hypothetical protein H6736_00095 [Alphaproteobacteria bacterium]|nr:hypothetical protein [Alphaproteobacteria bacterium]MCB9690192.1 hypothetical protein [Alphaproteobacteria bacterium]